MGPRGKEITVQQLQYYKQGYNPYQHIWGPNSFAMKIRMILILILIFGSGLKYLDLCISEKYETQFEGLNPTENQIKKAEELKEKKETNKKIALSLLAIYPVS
ncbi:hypothetical protein [Chryseobacterium bernardetii]|uniref:hypothetical protein n=1 Tax=Chryseobacterium bernardetii TaxID=1241978 RepID=UPI003AF80644